MEPSIYPQSPQSVPSNLTAASSAYKSRAWLAMGGLSLFLSLYIGLTAWFAWTAWRMFNSFAQGAEFHLGGAAAGVAAAFLFVFMVKALFGVKSSGESKDVELKQDEHPRLFEFLYTLADEAGAPRPHKVYVSPQVNAAVFYDLSLLNLIFPSRKNLLIGLGLVNVLNLGELKAVLAHEFGHFAQRSMAVGRWVYIAQQIAGHVIAKRDALDGFLNGLSRFDIRIAWVGWILRLIIWSIRSLLDSVFSLVILSERALSRQMEFQADLVAVSLTGSDALVHALNKLHAGDDAWNRTLDFVNQEVNEKRRTPDLFSIQSGVIEKLRKIYADDKYGLVDPVPSESPESHRVFTSNIASPPQMWSTHPENAAREENAKRVYVSCPIDTREAWNIFNQPEKVRQVMSEHLLANVKVELTPLSVDESLKNLDKFYAKTWLMPCYRGAYLGRSVVRNAEKVDDLYLPEKVEASVDVLDTLYPDSLSEQLEELRELHEEKHMLEALRDKAMKAAGGVIQFRGKSIKRKQLPEAINSVKNEIRTLEEDVAAHDKQVRSVHVAAAQKIGDGWEDYLKGLAAVLHYADHSEADINDVNGYVINVWSVITADGRISKAETKRLINAVSDAHSVMGFIYQHAEALHLNKKLLDKLECESFQKMLGEYNLPEPQQDNINEWMKVFDGWVGAFKYCMSQLRIVALEELLLTEARVAGALRQNKVLDAAPKAPLVPQYYKTLPPGTERELQKKLDLWDSFFTATGFFPALARFIVAVSIVGAVMWWGQSLGKMDITVYNGLARSVNVDIGGQSVRVGPFDSRTVSASPAKEYRISTKTDEGELVERFTQQVGSNSFQHNVYNVAAAAPVVQWWAAYGNARERDNRNLGAPRWLSQSADYYFTEPPEQIQIDGAGELRSILSGVGGLAPNRQLNYLESASEIENLITMHARWDDVNSTYYSLWLAYLSRQPNAKAILDARIAAEPNAVVLLRMEQNLADELKHSEVCERHTALANSNPENGGLNYLAIRCMEDGPAQDAAFTQGREQWPNNPWFALAVGYRHAHAGEWDNALEHYLHAVKHYRPLTVNLGDSILRMHRASANSPVSDVSAILDVNDNLYYALALESGAEFGGSPMLAYSHLHTGALQQALDVAAENETLYQRILMLVAASSEAQQAWIDEALALDIAMLGDQSAAWVGLALAAREGAQTSQYEDYIRSLGVEYAPVLMAFLDTLSSASGEAVYAEAEKRLQGIPPEARGYAYAMGAIYSGGRCPAKWKSLAKALLFVNERPHILI